MTGITLAELQAFHEIDRRAYAWFAYQLGLDSYTSKKIVAFWYWLETAGCKNFAHNALTLSPGMLQLLVMESTLCLNCVDGLPFYDSRRGDLLLMSVVGGKHLSLEFFYKNKGIAKKGILSFIKDVLDSVLSDLTQPIDAQSQKDNGSNSQITMENCQEDNGNQSQGNREVNEANEDLRSASQTDRTLFVTFSRGHPITKQQLAEFFNGRFGQGCVQDIVVNDGESLYAVVIVSSPSYAKRILAGNRLLQFNIHGKDVRVRQYIPKS